MKKFISILFSILISIIICFSTFAQVPKAFNYQAVVRDADGYVISNQSIGFRISIIQGQTTVYTETHSENTNQFGLVSFQIGNGTVENSSFDDINWGAEACFLKVEMDPTGGTNYTVSGIEQLLAVPYALYAETSGVGGSGGDGNNQDEIQDLTLIGNFLFITKNTNAKQLDLGKFMDNTDNQELQFNGNSLSITGGNSLTLPGESDPVFNASVAKTITDAGSFNVITNAERTELNNNSTLLNVTPGTISPGKAVVVDNNKDISSFRNLNASGVVQFGNTIIIDGTGLEGSITETHGKISFGDENIYTTGFVGAGTNTPGTNLHVVGGLRYVDGNQAANRILTTDINGNATWQDPAAQLPAQAGNGGKFLTTDGTDPSWASVTKSTVGLGLVENTALSTWGGTTNITTLGTIGTGIWQGTAINATYVGNLPASKITSGVFDNARINWAAPDAIGGTTAAGANFTTLNTSGNTTLGDASADAVVVKGALKVESGSPGVNKFLESDASGNANWGTITNTDITGLGTMSTQNKDAVDIDGGGIDATTVGANTPALGKFSSLESTVNLTLPATTATTGIYYSGTVPFIHSYGTDNLFIGKLAGNFTMTGSGNTAYGSSALNKNTTGFNNLANGYMALSSNTTGNYNVANGNRALSANTTGSLNVANGFMALTSNTSGKDNVANGYLALSGNISGNSNLASGYMALTSNTTGSSNVANGRGSLIYNTTGANNTANGTGALTSNKTGSNNTAIGYTAGYNSLGSSNVFLGYTAGFNETGSNKLYIDNSNTTTPLIYGDFGTDNLRINGTLEVSTTVKIEGGTPGAGKVLTSDASGNATWQAAGGSTPTEIKDADSDTKVQVEESADEDKIRFDLGGTEKWVMNGSHLASMNTGKSVFIGEDAGLNDDLSDNKNVFIGNLAGKSNTSGDYNTAVGNIALYNNTSGIANTAIGQASLYNNTTGESNTASGFDALALNTDGDENTAFGRASLYSNSTGNYNTGIGVGANTYNTTGSNNTIIGYQAGAGTVAHSKSGNVFLGYQAGYNETGSNKLYIDNSNTTTPLIYGDFSTNKVTINDVLNLAPRTAAPGSPANGDLYYNSTDHHIYCYVNGSWKQLDN